MRSVPAKSHIDDTMIKMTCHKGVENCLIALHMKPNLSLLKRATRKQTPVFLSGVWPISETLYDYRKPESPFSSQIYSPLPLVFSVFWSFKQESPASL